MRTVGRLSIVTLSLTAVLPVSAAACSDAEDEGSGSQIEAVETSATSETSEATSVSTTSLVGPMSTDGAAGGGSVTAGGEATNRSRSDRSTTRPTDVDRAAVTDDDGVLFYPGFDSSEGWRLAPITTADPLVTYWNRDGYRRTGHGGLVDRTPLEPTGHGPIAMVVDGYGVIFLQLEDDEQTIWRDDGDGSLTAVVTVPAPQRLTLEGALVSDLEDVDLFYQISYPGSPETSVTVLYRHRLPDGEAIEIVKTGGWESGTEFHDLNGSYPLTVATNYAEAAVWHTIVDLESGDVVYDGDRAGISCYDGEPDCPAYDVATLYNGDIYGVRSEWNVGGGSADRFALFRFDPDSGVEEVVTRFAWDNGLWYPYEIRVGGRGLLLSVGDFGGTAHPAVEIDPRTGEATTMAIAGFVGPGYLS